MNALTQQFDQFNISVINVTNSSCEICGAIDHSVLNCQIRVTPSLGV